MECSLLFACKYTHKSIGLLTRISNQNAAARQLIWSRAEQQPARRREHFRARILICAEQTAAVVSVSVEDLVLCVDREQPASPVCRAPDAGSAAGRGRLCWQGGLVERWKKTMNVRELSARGAPRRSLTTFLFLLPSTCTDVTRAADRATACLLIISSRESHWNGPRRRPHRVSSLVFSNSRLLLSGVYLYQERVFYFIAALSSRAAPVPSDLPYKSLYLPRALSHSR